MSQSPSRAYRRSGRSSGRGHGTHPYFFQRGPADVLEEALRELIRLQQRTSSRPEHEQDILEERRRKLFDHDPTMQQLFRNDFDAFRAALDDPERMRDELARHLERLAGGGDSADRLSPEFPRLWKTSWSGSDPATRGEDASASSDVHSTEDDDPLYDAMFRWACTVDRWGRQLYYRDGVKDQDLFRVFTNALLVPAKVAFGLTAAEDGDLPGYEVASVGFRQSSALMTSVLESLANCHGKGIGDEVSVHDLLDEGRDLLADVESRLAEIESEIRYRKGKR